NNLPAEEGMVGKKCLFFLPLCQAAALGQAGVCGQAAVVFGNVIGESIFHLLDYIDYTIPDKSCRHKDPTQYLIACDRRTQKPKQSTGGHAIPNEPDSNTRHYDADKVPKEYVQGNPKRNADIVPQSVAREEDVNGANLLVAADDSEGCTNHTAMEQKQRASADQCDGGIKD